MKTDAAWKVIIEDLFPQFVSFFMPDLYDFINFEIDPKPLDNEFAVLFPESVSNNRRVDKLFEVHLKDGNPKWILLNIEIQSYEDSDFDKRMYQHYARIFDKFDREIEAIVVYTYQADRHKYNKYESKFLKTRLLYEYRVYDIAKQKIKKLKKSNNPFSFVVQTLIKAFDYKETDEGNFNFKKELTLLLFKSGYSEYEIRRLFIFISFVFEIKDRSLREKFYSEVNEMSAVKNYRLELTDYEEVALEIRDKKVKKENTREISKKLKAKNMPLEEISEITGLSIEEIEKL